MSDKKYAIFQVMGGLGKNIAATAVAQVIKKAYPDRELICLASWPELWANLPFVYRVFPLGNVQYFYDEYTTQMISFRISGSFHWELPLIGFKVGNSSFQKPDFLHALIDTGTSIIILPPKDF